MEAAKITKGDMKTYQEIFLLWFSWTGSHSYSAEIANHTMELMFEDRKCFIKTQ